MSSQGVAAKKKSPLTRVGVLGACCVPAFVVFGWHFRTYLPFMADDAFISLRYSQRLANGAGLTWTEGERVEGYSNLLWVLLCAVGGLVTDFVSSARAVGLLSTAGTLLAIGTTFFSRPAGILASVVATVFLALSGPIAVWSIGGLEAPLVCFLIAVLVLVSVRAVEAPQATRLQLFTMATASALVTLSRPDALLLVGAIVLGVVFANGGRTGFRLATWVAMPSAAAYVAQLIFRLSYYREWIPNTARLKVKWTPSRLEGGFEYLMGSWRVLLPIVLFAVAGLVVRKLCKQPLRAAWVVLCPALFWSAYLVVIGGDIFPGRRHVTVLLVLFAILGAWAFSSLDLRDKRMGSVIVAAGIACIGTGAWWGTSDPKSTDARHERWEWEGEVSGTLFKSAWRAQKPLLAVHSAGCVPFFSELPALDLLGLSDAWIAKHLPPTYGIGSLSYDLHAVGDPDYVMRRKPDLVLPCGPLGHEGPCPSIPASMGLFAHPTFAASYVPARFRGEVPFVAEGTVYVHRESPVALKRQLNSYTIQPALLARRPATLVFDGNEAAVEFPAHARVVINQLPGMGTIDAAALRGIEVQWGAGGVLELINPTSAAVRLGPLEVRTNN